MSLLSGMIPWNKPVIDRPFQEGEGKKYILLYPSKENTSCSEDADMRTILYLLSQGEIEKALLAMKEQNPFPVVSGSLHSPVCEKEIPQTNSLYQNALAEIKKQLALYENSGKFIPPPPYPVLYSQNIAIVGAGPAGLSIALDLCRLGYKVAVFEKDKKACSSLYAALSEDFHKVLEKEIVFIQEKGVKISLQKEITSLDSLLTAYDVVVLTTGKNSAQFWSSQGLESDAQGCIQTDHTGRTSRKNVFASGEILSSESISSCIQKSHQVSLGIVSFLQNQPYQSKKQLPLPILRHYQSACPYHAVSGEKISQEKIVALSSATKCLYCGLWKKPEEFIQEGCLNCVECEHCLAACDFKQIFVKTENECFLAKTTESIAAELYPDKEKSLYSDGKKVCSLHSIVPYVSEEECVACGRCEDVCPYHAIRVVFRKGKPPVAQIDTKACRGCTLCVSACPGNAIHHFLSSSNKKTLENKTALFACRWSGMFENFETPDVLTLMCARYATPKILLLSLWHGADKVKVLSCPREACHYLGSSQAAQKIHKCQELLLEAGMPVESISSVLPDEKEQKETIEPLPRLQNISSKANSDLSEAFFAIQSFETLSVQPKKIEEQSALIPGGILLLEKLLESEEILPRGTFIESIRILLATIKKSVSLLPGISSLDIPWKEKELQQKAIQNLHSYIQNSSIKEIILAFPELYSGFLPLLLQDISLVSLPLILRKKLAFRECNHIVALHKPCFNSHYTQNLLQKAAGEEKFSSSKSLFIQQQEDFFADAMALLQEIPGLKVVPLLDACGHSFFRSFHQSQREVAYSLIKQAEKSKAPLLLSLSPYCAKHLSFMLRKGAWQESAMESKDIYSFLVECLC